MRMFTNLKVALIAGTLGLGGAEKQLVYVVRSLLRVGVDIRVYTLTRGEYYEPVLSALGVQVIPIGKHQNPLIRLVNLVAALRKFKPQILQSTHFYTNLYVSIVAPLCGAVEIGSVRSDIFHEMKSNPIWGTQLLHRPGSLIVNSQLAQRNAELLGVGLEKICCLPNAIDLESFDIQSGQTDNISLLPKLQSRVIVATVGRLIPVKRFDRFITALALARQQVDTLDGVIIGDGPEKRRLQAFAQQKGLSGNDLVFAGQRDDIPSMLRNAHIFSLTSDHEGFPNVLLEAMAARLPVITTPAGEAGIVIQDGLTGYVIPFEDVNGIATHMVRLAQSPELRQKLGQTGRKRVEQNYEFKDLAERLIMIYEQIARQRHSRRLIEVLNA